MEVPRGETRERVLRSESGRASAEIELLLESPDHVHDVLDGEQGSRNAIRREVMLDGLRPTWQRLPGAHCQPSSA